MRLATPIIIGFPKVVPAGGDIICGKHVPEGTEIYINHTGLMQNQEVFGQDVNVFRPERFIECDAATKAKRLKVVDLNFGHGRWLCLGKVLAVMEINKIFVEVSRQVVYSLRSFLPPKFDRISPLLSYYHILLHLIQCFSLPGFDLPVF